MLLLVLAAAAARAQFVGSKACAGCHAAEYRAQSKSEHARALAVASAGSPGHWAFGAGDKAITYVSQAGDDWYVEHGLSYYPAIKKMAPTPGHPDGADLRYRTFDPTASVLRCFRCHSTGSLYLGSGHSVEPSEPGVHCESCHGEGAAHVKANGAAGSILNPKRLNAAELNEYCGTCHRKPPEAGEEADWTNAWNVRHQPTYLNRAACFRKSGAALTCLTCHDPHAPLDHAAVDYDRRCVGCHKAVRHRASVAGQTCVGCHMPQVRASAQLEFTNHWIGVYAIGNRLIPMHR